jgi:hypothetical protein
MPDRIVMNHAPFIVTRLEIHFTKAKVLSSLRSNRAKVNLCQMRLPTMNRAVKGCQENNLQDSPKFGIFHLNFETVSPMTSITSLRAVS